MAEPLPVDSILPALLSALDRNNAAVLTAPPGSGKTTRVPLALIGAPWLDGRRVIVLEPRRLAARAAAAYMARLLGEAVGETVGYRIRMDSKVGPRTRIEVVTEGVLTRMLQDDPALDGVGVVAFDEFHERSIHADLGLALALQSQALLRPDLRLLVMSATLDSDAVAGLLGRARGTDSAPGPAAAAGAAGQPGPAPVIRAEGRMYAVETRYAASRVEGFIEAAVASTVIRAVHEHDGDVLVFLPGVAEIRRTADRLEAADLPRDVAVMPLYGDLPQDAQDRAIAPSPPGRRKIVLATAIAETSLTIEGVRVVVDSGLMRVPRFSPRTGMTRLETVPVSRAAADQRRGRAGRVAPGVCYRLWPEADHAALMEHRPPEILEADLAPLALELAAWGVRDASELRWLDPPPEAALGQARELLRELGALSPAGNITGHGRSMARLGLHPRLAHLLLRGLELGVPDTATKLAALLSERDLLRAPDGRQDPDIRLRLHVLDGGAPPHGHSVNRGVLHRVRADARQWRDRLRSATRRRSGGSSDLSGSRASSRSDESAAPGAFGGTASDVDELVGVLLAFAYPDRIGQQRGGRGRYLLRNGRGAAIDPSHALGGAAFLVAAEVGGQGRDSRIFLGAPIRKADIETHFAGDVVSDTSVGWDATTQGVRAVATARLGALALAERPLRDVPPDAVAAAVADGIRTHGLSLLHWDRDAERLRQRLAFLRHAEPGTWPAMDDESLLAEVDDWLVPFLDGIRNTAGLRRLDLVEPLMSRVGWQRRAAVDELAPTHVDVPSGSRIPIDYSDPAAPVLAVRLQEMFGLADTPRIAGGRVPLTLHLLSPARRPVQVTQDLASFWESAYFQVRKDLRGRYPKHHWPENPLEARATHRTKPRTG